MEKKLKFSEIFPVVNSQLLLVNRLCIRTFEISPLPERNLHIIWKTSFHLRQGFMLFIQDIFIDRCYGRYKDDSDTDPAHKELTV